MGKFIECHTKFRGDRTNRSQGIAFTGPPSWILKFEILTVYRFKRSYCITVPNFVVTGETTEIWRFFIFFSKCHFFRKLFLPTTDSLPYSGLTPQTS